MDREEFLGTLLEGTGKYELDLSAKQAGACYEHVSLMLEWNRRCNLTRITDLRGIVEKHLLDSLIPSRWLPHSGSAMDIGTGPGFPGLPLKILFPGLEMSLLESHRRKVSFLKVVLSRLALEKVKVLESRWEDLIESQPSLRPEPLALATMRAVKLEPAHLSQFAEKMLRTGGLFAWWAGPSTDSTALEMNSDAWRLAGLSFEGRHTYQLPSASRPRHIFIWRKC